MGMVEPIAVETVIDAPAELVYSLVSDLPRMAEWSPEAVGGRWIGEGGQVGARFIGRNRAAKRSWSTLAKVTAADPGKRFAFRVTAPLLAIAEWEYRIEPTNGGCRVQEIFIDRRSSALKYASTLRTGVGDRASHNLDGMNRTLAALKAAAEAGSPN